MRKNQPNDSAKIEKASSVIAAFPVAKPLVIKGKMLGQMTVAEGKAVAILSHLVEDCSVRSTEQLTGVHRETILDLLNIAGRKCEALMLKLICAQKVQDVQCDEV